MMLNEFPIHFLRPWWLLLFLPLGVMWWFLKQSAASKNPWKGVCDDHLLPHLIQHSPHGKPPWPWLVLGLCWLMAVLALSGPSWSKRPQPLYQKNQSTLILFDLSRSMGATDLKPSRLVRAKYKLRDFLARYKEGRIGLIAFAAEPYVVTPLSEDSQTLTAMLPELSPNIMPVQGSYIGAALRKSAELLTQGHAESGQVILFTDSAATKEDVATAQKLARQGITTQVFAIGTEKRAPVPGPEGSLLKDPQGKLVITQLDLTSLRTLAAAGGGQLVRFQKDNSDIQTLLALGKDSDLPPQASDHQNRVFWNDDGLWLVWLLLPLVALVFRRGWFQETLQ